MCTELRSEEKKDKNLKSGWSFSKTTHSHTAALLCSYLFSPPCTQQVKKQNKKKVVCQDNLNSRVGYHGSKICNGKGLRSTKEERSRSFRERKTQIRTVCWPSWGFGEAAGSGPCVTAHPTSCASATAGRRRSDAPLARASSVSRFVLSVSPTRAWLATVCGPIQLNVVVVAPKSHKKCGRGGGGADADWGLAQLSVASF